MSVLDRNICEFLVYVWKCWFLDFRYLFGGGRFVDFKYVCIMGDLWISGVCVWKGGFVDFRGLLWME